MAKNAAAGNGRLGPIKNRIQSLNPRTKQWVKTNTKTGKFIDVKGNGTPFKGIRKSKAR